MKLLKANAARKAHERYARLAQPEVASHAHGRHRCCRWETTPVQQRKDRTENAGASAPARDAARSRLRLLIASNER
jgi:hypothetical protein